MPSSDEHPQGVSPAPGAVPHSSAAADLQLCRKDTAYHNTRKKNAAGEDIADGSGLFDEEMMTGEPSESEQDAPVG